MVRAAVMSGLSLVAVQIGRSGGGLNALLLAAGVMCLFNPNLPWDVSFQLSFAATLGLLLYASRLEGLCCAALPSAACPRAGPARSPGWSPRTCSSPSSPRPSPCRSSSIILGASRWSRPLANLFVLPVQSALMILSGLASLLGMLWLPLGRVLAPPAWALAAYTLRVVDWLGGSPGAEIVTGPGSLAVGCPGLCRPARVGCSLGLDQGQCRAGRPALALLLLAGLAVFLWRQALAGPDGNLHLVASNFDGQVAVLVRAPQGQTLLIGGAPRASQLSAGLGRWLPPLGRHLDGVLINDGRANALQALPDTWRASRRVRPIGAWTCPKHAAGRRLQDFFTARGTPQTRLEAGQRLDLGDGVRLDVLVCAESGCALLLEYGSFSCPASRREPVRRLARARSARPQPGPARPAGHA